MAQGLNNRRLLITGIPGTGKTAIGDTLFSHEGFSHWDVEKLGAVPDLSVATGRIVMTWGFVPDGHSINTVKRLVSQNTELIWFDGNRDAALREFNRRGTVPEMYFHIQVDRIEKSNVIEALKPRIINTFDEKGEFRRKTDIIKEILEGR